MKYFEIGVFMVEFHEEQLDLLGFAVMLCDHFFKFMIFIRIYVFVENVKISFKDELCIVAMDRR
ncbi:hypothetical protein D3C75_1134060 [compost metagenome]